MAEAPTHGFERHACLSAEAGVRATESVKRYLRHAAATNESANCAPEAPWLDW